MKIKTNIEIARIFREFANKIEKGTCDVDSETLTDIANKLIHIKLNYEEMCRYINVSRPTLTRMIADGRVPRPRKVAGGKEYWYQDEVDEHIDAYNEKYGTNYGNK